MSKYINKNDYFNKQYTERFDNMENKENKTKDEIFNDIKKNILLLEKSFLDNVLSQIKNKNVKNKNTSVEKLAFNELNKYKKDIEILKNKVITENNTDKIIKLENKLKENEEILQKLNNEKEGLENISKQQLKALEDVVLNETQIQIQIKQKEIRKIKDETMQLKCTYNNNETLLKKKQEQLINLDNQLKKKINLIKNLKNTNTSQNITSSNTLNSNVLIKTLKEQIDMINNNIFLDNKLYDEQISELKKNINDAEKDIEFLTYQIDEIKQNIEKITLNIKKMRKQKKEKL